MKKGPGIAIAIGPAPRGKGRGEGPDMPPEPMGYEDEESEEMGMSSLDMALDDAFTAVKMGDSKAFKEAMLDAFDSFQNR